MTREEYIESAVSQIQDKYIRAEVEAEIAAHLDDRMGFYLDAGYDYDYALAHAIDRMGDSSKYSESLSKLHKGRYTLSQAYWMLALGVFNVIMWLGMASESWDFYWVGFAEMWAAIPIFEGLIAAINCKNKKLPLLLLAYHSIYLAVHIAIIRLRLGANMGMAFSSALVVIATEFFSGNISSVESLVCFVREYSPAPLQIILSALVYTGVYALIIAVIVQGKKKFYGLAAKKKGKRMKTCATSAFIVSITIFLLILVFQYIGLKTTEKDMVVIVESDSACDFTKLAGEGELADILYDTVSTQITDGKNTVYINFVPVREDYGAPFEYRYADTGYNEIDAETSSYKQTAKAGLLEYTEMHNVIDYQPTHRYVYAFAIESYESNTDVEFDVSQWQSTEKAHAFILPVEQTSCPVNITHVQTSPCLQNA